MNIVELLVFILIIWGGVYGAKLGNSFFGIIGGIVGAILGGAVVVFLIWISLRIIWYSDIKKKQ